MISRRTLIKSILAGGATFLGGIAGLQWYEQSSLHFEQKIPTSYLNHDDQLLLAVLIPVFAQGISAQPEISRVLGNIDKTVSLLPQRSQNELRELLDLLSSSMGKVLIAGVWVNWQNAAFDEISHFLDSWRQHLLSLLQQAYIGLQQLIMGAIYAEDSAWQAIGYPGPPFSLSKTEVISQVSLSNNA